MSTIDENWNIVDVTRAFCQKVLPLVYDESLSYMEMVCKMSSKLNEVIENNNNLPQYVKDLIKETVNSDEFAQIVGSVLMNTIINVKFPPEEITPAKGDGVTDDTKSIQDCLDYANAQGGAVVFFPSGKYLTSTLSIAGKTSILGADRYNTTLFLKGGGSTPMLQGVINQSVRNIAFDGNRLNQIEENYLIDGDIENALIDNVIFEDSAHCITSEKCNANEFSNVKVLDIGDSVFIDAIGSGNLLSNINTSYSIIITGDNNNWQSPQQTKIDSVEPLEYQQPQVLNTRFKYVQFSHMGTPYNVLVENNIEEEAFVNVLDFGIKNDGSEDVSSVLNVAMKDGGNFFFPDGVYLVSEQLVLNSNTTILGESHNAIIRSSADSDLVYHTVCNVNASNIDARLSRNESTNGYPSAGEFMTNAQENINIMNVTIDGNWQNRNTLSWNKVYNGHGVAINREPGTALELQFVKNCNVRACNVINGPQHNINIRGGAGSYGEGVNYVALYPSKLCTISECTTQNQLYDDCITTHDSELIDIKNCYVFVDNSSRNAAISNGIEIDDGSRFILVEGCTSEGSFTGFQTKGHANTPSAHHVTFRNCLAKNVHNGFLITCDTTLTPEIGEIVGQVRFINIEDCSIENIYPFNNATSYQGTSYIVLTYGSLFLKIDGLVVNGINSSDFNNKGDLLNCYCRFRYSTHNTTINNLFVNAQNDTISTQALLMFEGGARNIKLNNVLADINDNRYVVSSTYNAQYTYYDFNNVEKKSNSFSKIVKIGSYDKNNEIGFIAANINFNNVRATNANGFLWQANTQPNAISYTGQSNIVTTINDNDMIIVNENCTITSTTENIRNKAFIACSSTALSEITLTITIENTTYNRTLMPGGYLTIVKNNLQTLFVSN